LRADFLTVAFFVELFFAADFLVTGNVIASPPQSYRMRRAGVHDSG
jgi:hypothetical protein